MKTNELILASEFHISDGQLLDKPKVPKLSILPQILINSDDSEL